MKKLSEQREDKGLTQPALAARVKSLYPALNLSVSTIWRAEHGQSISRVNAKAICTALDCSLADIEEFKGMVSGPLSPAKEEV